jgi:hypothetical protein
VELDAVGLEREGFCDGAPVRCASTADCAAGQYCATWSLLYPNGSPVVCPGPGLVGYCRAMPAAPCPAGDPPACGCDGAQYPSACAAARAGVMPDPSGAACR